jgi:hypothetical protein
MQQQSKWNWNARPIQYRISPNPRVVVVYLSYSPVDIRALALSDYRQPYRLTDLLCSHTPTKHPTPYFPTSPIRFSMTKPYIAPVSLGHLNNLLSALLDKSHALYDVKQVRTSPIVRQPPYNACQPLRPTSHATTFLNLSRFRKGELEIWHEI